MANVFAREWFLPTERMRHWVLEERLGAAAIAKQCGVPFASVRQQLRHALLAAPSLEVASAPIREERALDASQQTAAFALDRPTLVLAGPGTGKTRTLVGRIAYLLARGVPAEAILVITHSNKAAQELRERVHRLSPAAASATWIGTFHALGLELLRKYGGDAEAEARPRVLDGLAGRAVLEGLLPSLELSHYQSLSRPSRCFRDLVAAISHAKDELAGPAEYHRLAQAMLDRAGSESGSVEAAGRALEVARVYAAYQGHLEEKHLLD